MFQIVGYPIFQAGNPLPDKYRFLLFEDKREVELVWNGKTNEICNIVLPFQVIEQVDEPRTKKDRKLELTSVFHEFEPGRRKLAVKVVDIFGNDTMTIVEVTVGGKK